MSCCRHLLLVAALFAFLRTGDAAGPAKSVVREAVGSTSLKSVGYDANSKTLEVEFNNGGIYRYFAVPVETHRELMKSGSKGKFFTANIRGKFRFERIDTR